jgi:hypothetical protein
MLKIFIYFYLLNIFFTACFLRVKIPARTLLTGILLSRYLLPISSYDQNVLQIHHLPSMQPCLPDTYLPYVALLQPQQTHPLTASFLPLLFSILFLNTLELELCLLPTPLLFVHGEIPLEPVFLNASQRCAIAQILKN